MVNLLGGIGQRIFPESTAASAVIRYLFGTSSAIIYRNLPRRRTACRRREHESTEEREMAKQSQDQPTADNTQKDPDQWVTGDESMTGAQASYLRTLAQEAGEPVDEELTKAEASKRIDELQERTGRGRDH
jgi:hypothetical protein